MNEITIYKGNWWLPESPDCEVLGEFRFTQEDGGWLELQGDLHAPQGGQFHPPTFKNAPLILGITSSGKEVSLLDCLQTTGNIGISKYIGTPETRYRVTFSFIGVHFPSSASISFNKMAIRFSYLEEWLDQNPFDIKQPDITKEILIHSVKPDTVDINIVDYKISFAYGVSTQRPGIGELIISHKAWVIICSETDAKPLETFLDIMRRIQDFIAFGVGQPIYPIEIEGYSEINKQTLENSREFYPPIQIFYPFPWTKNELSRLHPSQMVFSMKAIPNLELFLNRWFERADDIKPVLDIAFSLFYQESIYSEYRFLGMAQAVETYHRRRFGGKYMPDEIFLEDLYQKLLKAIPTYLDPGYKESLKRGKLRYANEYSLRKRLVELTDHLARFLPFHFLAKKKERNLFVEAVCDTRNYLTHYDPELKSKAFTNGEDLYMLALKLRLLLDALLMGEIGFEPEQIITMLMKNQNYSDLVKS